MERELAPRCLTRRQLLKLVGFSVTTALAWKLENPLAPKSERLSSRLSAAAAVADYVTSAMASGQPERINIACKDACLWLWGSAITDLGGPFGLPLSSAMMREYLYSSDPAERDLTPVLADKLDAPAIINSAVAAACRTRASSLDWQRIIYPGVVYYSVPAGTRANPDLYLAFGHSTFSLNYHSAEASSTQVVLTGPQVMLTDIYDFKGSNSELPLASLVSSPAYFPSWLPLAVKSTFVEIFSAADKTSVMAGARLKDFGHLAQVGLATEFPLHARLTCPPQINITFPHPQ